MGEQQPPIRVGEQKEYKLDLPSKVRPQPFNRLQTARESKETRARAKQQEASSQACGGGIGSEIGGSRKEKPVAGGGCGGPCDGIVNTVVLYIVP